MLFRIHSQLSHSTDSGLCNMLRSSLRLLLISVSPPNKLFMASRPYCNINAAAEALSALQPPPSSLVHPCSSSIHPVHFLLRHLAEILSSDTQNEYNNKVIFKFFKTKITHREEAGHMLSLFDQERKNSEGKQLNRGC